MKRKFIAALTVFVLLSNSVYASIVGNNVLSWTHDIADGTKLYKNEFMSDQTGVGKQTEYYATYTPNSSVVPTVITSGSIWGRRTISKAEEYMKANGLVPLLGINASYFSYKTGIPMGHVISDGKITSKDLEEYQALGFNEDGTAFIDKLKIKTFLKSNDTEIEISHINKYNQDVTPIVNLYTDDFSENTHNEVASLYLILGSVDGELKINSMLTAVVEEKFNYQGSIKIPKGKIVLSLNENSDENLYASLNSLEVGNEVNISSYAVGNDLKWEKAKSVIASVGERLVSGGEIQSGFGAGAAARTAVGIKQDGTVVFYVIDGKQKGYSYGLKLSSLAKRMKELDCIDAVNLDGGGSTSLSGVYPGMDTAQIINLPEDGSLCKCATFIFLKNNRQSTGELGNLYIYPFEQHYLTGYSENLFVTAVDTAYYPMDTPYGVSLGISGGESSIDTETNVATFKGDGIVEVTATSGDVIGKEQFHSHENPTKIVAKKSNGTAVDKLTLKKNDEISLNFDAYYNDLLLKSKNELFSMEIESGIGEINGNTLKITSDGGQGTLKVYAGKSIKEIPVTVTEEFPFIDILNHWAKGKIKAIFKNGIISGYESNEGLKFMPDNQITREEFSVMVSKFLKIDASEFINAELGFDDKQNISDWAKPYVAALTQKGVIYGKQSGKKLLFDAKNKLTRAEAITILGRILNLEITQSSKFSDDLDIPEWAKNEIYKMVSNGFVSGYEDNTVRPNNRVTRAEAATIISNIIDKAF